MARPTKLNAERSKMICDALALGSYARHAANFAGVSEATLRAWMVRGRREEAEGKTSIYTRLVSDVEKAEAQASVRALTSIQRAAQGDWRAAAWFQTHRFPEWADHTKVDATVQLDTPEFVATVEELVALARGQIDGSAADPSEVEVALAPDPADS